MANSASDARHSEADIRQALIENNLIYGMLTLPSNMFYTVTLPATLWFKAEFHFAAAGQVPRLMDELDRKYLHTYTPCNGLGDELLVEALAVVHVEFVLIRPFREGNGRLARLIATIMALQAGKPALDFSYFDKNKSVYFSAIQAGMSDYTPMKKLFRQVLQESDKNV